MENFPAGTDLATHPNDAFFKAIFSEPEHATAFFNSHLPPAIAERIDWPSLVVIPTSFVKSSLHQVHSDLLFSVQLGGRKTLLYLLFEHQSTVDPTMPLRLFGYIGEILTQHHKAHGLPLPPVLPFVLHQGPENWNVSTAFEDLFELPDDIAAELLPFLPKFHHGLLDLSRCDPASEETDSQLRIVLNLMKLARTRQLLEYFLWLAETVISHFPERLLARLLIYALHADSELDAQQIYRSLSSNPELEKKAMSVAEKLKAEGRVEGRTEGRVEGRTEGRVEGRVAGRAEGLSQGLWIGKIQTLEEFLGRPTSSGADLESLSALQLEDLHLTLHREYEVHFKNR